MQKGDKMETIGTTLQSLLLTKDLTISVSSSPDC